ncbi:unnamed protein product [Eretmochelys imbricata]
MGFACLLCLDDILHRSLGLRNSDHSVYLVHLSHLNFRTFLTNHFSRLYTRLYDLNVALSLSQQCQESSAYPGSALRKQKNLACQHCPNLSCERLYSLVVQVNFTSTQSIQSLSGDHH